MRKLTKFINISKSMEELWAEYKGLNAKLNKKNREIDELINSLEQGDADSIEIGNYVDSKTDNYFEKILWCRYLYKIDLEKCKSTLEYIAQNDKDGMAGFLARGNLTSLEHSKWK